MKLYSTNDKALRVDFSTAVFQSLPKDKGLFMPEFVPKLPSEFWDKLPGLSLPDIGKAVTKLLLGDVFSVEDIDVLIDGAINFPAPLVRLSPKRYTLELFQGPSLAFKDFGARFMSRTMSALLGKDHDRLVILVATSGDTGGAVAAGFYGNPHIDVVILYPAGKVSDVQEAQLTTLGDNIFALRVAGTFDDCQAMVKDAFVDQSLRDEVNISSANSINISRLIPQTFYYFEAYKQWRLDGNDGAPVICVPSGNYGNLTAGLIAQRMGLPVRKFIAATNANDTVVGYAGSGEYRPKPSVRTLSNAMDVGSPSNFDRMMDLFGSTWNVFKDHVYAASFSDHETEEEMRRQFVDGQYPYVFDPHTAVGSLALRRYQSEVEDVSGIVLGTAHAGKFGPDVERVLGEKIALPDALQQVLGRPRTFTEIAVDYEALKKFVLEKVWSRKQMSGN